VQTHLFAAYARLPQDVSHQDFMHRLGIALEVDEDGLVIDCSATLLMQTAQEYFRRLLVGRSVIADRDRILDTLHTHWHGQSQAALIAAVGKVFEAVDHTSIGRKAVPDGEGVYGTDALGEHAVVSRGPSRAR